MRNLKKIVYAYQTIYYEIYSLSFVYNETEKVIFYNIGIYSNTAVSIYNQRWAVRFGSPLIRCSGLSFSKRISASVKHPKIEVENASGLPKN